VLCCSKEGHMAYQCPEKDNKTGLPAIFLANKETTKAGKTYTCFNVNIGSRPLKAERYEMEEDVTEWAFTGIAHWMERTLPNNASLIPLMTSGNGSSCSSMPSLLYDARHGEEMNSNKEKKNRKTETVTTI
jgi:hypothetical protein